MSTQETQWKLVADVLRRACDEVGRVSTSGGAAASVDVPHGPQGQFAMFLEHNELALAWDELALLADEARAPATVWQKLLLAAGLMSSAEQAHQAAMRLCEVGAPAARAL